MTYDTWDELLTELMKEDDRREQKRLDDEYKDIALSPALKHRIEQMIAEHTEQTNAPTSAQRPKRRPMTVLRVLQRATAAVMIVLLLGTTLYFVSPTAQALIRRIIQTVLSDHNAYRFDTEPVEIQKGDYSLGYIPEGFELVEEISSEISYTAIYKNEKEDRLVFSFNSADVGTIAIDNENMVHEKITINGMEGYIAHAEEELFTVAFVLDDGMVLEITGDFDDETAIKILENIQKNR